MKFAALLGGRNRPMAGVGSFHAASRTHVGRIRTVNEDRLLSRPDRGMWAVADGMGGHCGGAAAATTVIEALDTLANGAQTIDEMAVRTTLERANLTIHDRPHDAAGTSGTTIVCAILDGGTATICWAGDSRAYLIRDGVAALLTHDHSVVQELVDAGMLSDAAAVRHPQANVITRAIGVAPTITVDSVQAKLMPGDRLLLCSDGASRSIDPRDFLTMPKPIDCVADRLLANALQRDGSDNATLIVIADIGS